MVTVEGPLRTKKGQERFVRLMSVRLMGGALALISMGNQTYAQTKHQVTFEDLAHFASTESLALSPNGRELAYTLEDTEEKNLGLWLIDTAKGSVPRRIADGRFPVWSPDGARLAYYSRESGTLQLWVCDAATGHKRQLTHLVEGIRPDARTVGLGYSIFDAVRYAWSPDGAKIVFSSQVSVPASEPNRRTSISAARGDPGKPLILTSKTPPDWTLAGLFVEEATTVQREWHDGKQDHRDKVSTDAPMRHTHLFIADVQTGMTIQRTGGAADNFSPDWAPDGTKIVYVSTEGAPWDAYWVHTNLHLIDPVTGDDQALTKDQIYKHTPTWSPNGRWISYFGINNQLVSRVSLFVQSIKGGPPLDASAKLDRRIFDAHWLSDGKIIAVEYLDGVNTPIARLDFASGQASIVEGSRVGSKAFIFATSRSGAIAWTADESTNPGIIHVALDSAEPSYALLDLNPKVASWELPLQEVVHYVTHHGEQRDGILLKPRGYKRGRRYPLIVDGYVRGNGFKAFAMDGNVALAAQGYAVFWPNAEAPQIWMNPFASIAHQSAARGPKGLDLLLDDAMSGVNALVARGIADPEHMCLYGFSNGGAVVNQLVTMTHRFKCAVSVSAALSADWAMPFFLQTDAQFIPQIAGTTPWEDPQAYMRLSAVYRLDKVNTPMLLAAGDGESMFLLSSIEMYNGLRYLGKDVTLLRYAGQGHGFEGDALMDFWNREREFFNRYLRTGALN